MRILVLIAGVLLIAVAAISGRTLIGPIMSGAILMPFHPAADPVQHDLPSSYEPLHRGHVDNGTGVYYRQDEDLVLPGTPPFILQRTYRSKDPVSRHFGVGATHNGEWYLRGDPTDFQWAELILEDSMRIRFERRSAGGGVSNAMFEHVQSATEFFRARLGWVGMFWAMTLRDGTIMIFKPCGPAAGDACSITRMRDSDNHWTHFRRDKGGRLREIAAGDATIAFDYDAADRVTRARASTGDFTQYRYDSGGRLIEVTTRDGITRSYTYGPSGEMLTIDEPGWFIRNTYRNGRVVRQDTDVRDGEGSERRLTFTWTYEMRGERARFTEVTRPDRTRSRYEFDEFGYHIAETVWDAHGRAAHVVLDRIPVSRGVTALSVTCSTGARFKKSEHELVDRTIEDATDELLQSCWQK